MTIILLTERGPDSRRAMAAVPGNGGMPEPALGKRDPKRQLRMFWNPPEKALNDFINIHCLVFITPVGKRVLDLLRGPLSAYLSNTCASGGAIPKYDWHVSCHHFGRPPGGARTAYSVCCFPLALHEGIFSQ